MDHHSKITPLLPYQELLIEAGRQIGMRKGVIARRILLYGWPILLTLVLCSLIVGAPALFGPFDDSDTNKIVIGTISWIVFMLVYVGFAYAVFMIEKRVWIDSFFDGRNLTPTESWRIARRLLPTIVCFWIVVFIRYYLLPTVTMLVVVPVAAFVLLTADDSYSLSVYLVTVVGLATIVFLIMYAFYLTVKLRFLWFIFLDFYGGQYFSASSVFEEQEKLSKIAGSERFKQALLIHLGTSTVSTIAQMAFEQISLGINLAVSTVSKAAGKVVGSAGIAYSKEYTQQVASIGNIAAMYILYREARSMVGEKSVIVNEQLYKLAIP